MAVFLQTDPVPGGSANAYDYAMQDPINKFDLDGQCWSWAKSVCGAAKKTTAVVKGSAHVVLDVIAVPVYAVYYGSYEIRGHSPVWLRWTFELPLSVTETLGLFGDAGLDWVKGHTVNHEPVGDEGIRGGIFPRWFFGGGPKIYLPGIHAEGHIDFK